MPVISEPRLRDDLARRLNAVERRLSFSAPFRAPPTGDGRQLGPARGISVQEFPRWFVCQGCRALVRATDGLNEVGGHYVHDCDGAGKPARCVPMRFVGACVNGHLDDFPWIFFTHEQGKRCEAPSMRFLEGTTGDFSEMRVTCVCGAVKPLFHATVADTNPTCLGERPWLGPASKEPGGCSEHVRLLVRSASNGYFSQVESALSLPEDDSLLRAVESVRALISTATAATLPIFRQIEAVKIALAGFKDEEVLGALSASTRGPPKREPLRVAEYRTLLGAPAETPGDLADRDEMFFARAFVPKQGLPAGLSRIVLLSKLREVRVQVGFTRIESASPDVHGEFDLTVRSSPLSTEAIDWLPAHEVRGEGFFIQLDEEWVRAWEDRPEVEARAATLLRGYERWAAGQSRKPPPFPGIRYYLLHALSHSLISAVSLECGYAASAIREHLLRGTNLESAHGRDSALDRDQWLGRHAGRVGRTGTPGTQPPSGGLGPGTVVLE